MVQLVNDIDQQGIGGNDAAAAGGGGGDDDKIRVGQ